MKKIYFGIAIILACSNVQAQYKKASFLNKSGRTYDVGFAGRFLSDGGGAMPGIYYSYGRDKGKHVFHWFDLELLLPTKFKYNTVDLDDATVPVTVSGKSRLSLLYRYNFAYYIINTENTESKIRPFVTAGINFLIAGGSAKTYDYTPEETSPLKIPAYGNNFSYGANAGIGGIYAISEKIGIKLMAGYNWQGQLSPDFNNNYGQILYKTYSNHPYVSAGVRFVMTGDGE